MHLLSWPSRALWATILSILIFSTSIHTSPVPSNATCTEDNIQVRKEWSTLTSPEKSSYLNALLCLQSLPPQTPQTAAPGVRTRYDDFTALHANNTIRIHSNGVFLAWHRHFLHLFHTALKSECNYTGTLPYWNWAWSSSNISAHPIFASPSSSEGDKGGWLSFGGNGYKVENKSLAMSNGNYTYPRGEGGGCISSGPFTNLTVPFRSFANSELALPVTPTDALSYAPRCITRDLNNAISSVNFNQSVVDTLLAKPTIQEFQAYMDNVVPNTPVIGPHPGVHWAVGWGLEDQYASPGDPVFFLHHGMVDLVWAEWQTKDPAVRGLQVAGTNRSLNLPPSVNVTLDFEMGFGYLDKPVAIREAMDTRGGKYCYRYEYDQCAPAPFLS